jgi:hypothetical protein
MRDQSARYLTTVLTLAGALGAGACASGEIDEPQAPAPASAQAPSHTFADQQAMLDWLAAMAGTQPLPSAQISRDAHGRVQGVMLGTDQDRQAVIAALGGPDAILSVGGEAARVQVLLDGGARAPSTATTEGIATTAQALSSNTPACQGSFCTANESHNTHVTIFGFGYHDVGGSTTQTQGGWRTWNYSPITLTIPGCSSDSRIPCTYDGCYPGDTYVGNTRLQAFCRHVEGWNHISVSVTYFVGNRVPILFENNNVNNTTTVTTTKTGYGKFLFPCNFGGPAECELNGACTAHSADGSGGTTIVSTAAGSTNCF